MDEKTKRRIPKWDVASELHVDSVGQESALLEKVDDPCMNLAVLDSMNPIISMNLNSSDVNQSATESRKEGNNNSDDICEKTQFSGQFDLEDDCKDGLKKQDWEPASQVHSDDICEKTQFSGQFDLKDDCKYGVKKQDWEPASQVHSDDICEKTEFSGQFDLKDDCKYGLKKQDWELASQERTITEHTENQDKSHKAVNDMSLDPEERHQRTRNMSPIDDRSRLHRKRSRSRSPSHDSRSRSWSGSRGKSPSYVSKQGSERWTDKGRMRGMTETCRAFAAGKCRRGNECSYLHEGGCSRQIERHHGAGLTDGRGIRPERERQPVQGSNETLTDTAERNKYSREKLHAMHEEHHEDGSAANFQHHGYRSNERCYDFTKGRCFRGEACRYIHHDASSDGGWNVKDEFRGSAHDRRDESASFTRRFQRQKLSDIPCKYFLRGHCVHGEGCKFYHQLDGSRHSFASVGPAGNITSTNASEKQDHTAQFSSTNPRGGNSQGIGHAQPIDKQKFSKGSLYEDGHKKPHSSDQQATTSEVCEKLLHAQNSTQTSSIQQFTPPIPLKEQMLQVMHSHYQNGKNQFAALDKPPDPRSFNPNIQNHSANPSCYQLNPQNLDSSRGQVQQNISMLSHSGSNFNHNGPPIHNLQNQPDFNVSGQNQQIKLGGHDADSSQFNSDNSISHKVVTSEQAAKITDLSASLAQFFGNAATTPQAFLNPNSIGSFATPVAPPPTEVEGSQTNLSHSTPKHNEQIHVIDTNKQNGDAESGKDLDTKKIKEAKEMRLFKCSLVEFVKDTLKPKWKEGQLSKEAYKTIVKKVVEKVCGSLQGPNVPQTQEKIDLYLLNCKAKLTKLVQAYVEKFVNS